MPLSADARPTKRFFIDNLTRDLSLEDAILDLIDNSVDAFVRTREIDVSPALLRAPERAPQAADGASALVSVSFVGGAFEILDRCGGIPLERAEHFAFRFGRADSYLSSLGVYGIGLKRAIFKIGQDITIESRTTTSGFRIAFDVPTWAEDDANWTLPMEALEPAADFESAGTRIVIRGLLPEVMLRIADPTLINRLNDAIGSTYSLFLTRFLTVSVNAIAVPARSVPLGVSDEISAAFKELSYGEVSCELLAGLAGRRGGEWNLDRAGWYVLCNGRVVVAADKTDLTGWGLYSPQFVSKYRGFVGIAFFFSKEPALLPWTTTKRGLNLESQAYQLARKEMALISRPVLTFLNKMYPGAAQDHEEVQERRMAEKLETTDVRAIVSQPEHKFTASGGGGARRKKTTTSIQFLAEKSDIERVRKQARHPEWSAGQVGRHTFEHFLRTECPE